MIYESKSVYETKRIAKDVSKTAKSGDIFCLDGEIGAGKTSFAQGFAEGLLIKENIVSPTFTILNIYCGKLNLYHFDVYRISSIQEMLEVGYEEFFFGDGVCLIEWSNIIEEIIPKYAVKINIEKNLDKGEDYRLIKFEK